MKYMLGPLLTLLGFIIILGVKIEKNHNKIKELEKELEELNKELEIIKASKE